MSIQESLYIVLEPTILIRIPQLANIVDKGHLPLHDLSQIEWRL